MDIYYCYQENDSNRSDIRELFLGHAPAFENASSSPILPWPLIRELYSVVRPRVARLTSPRELSMHSNRTGIIVVPRMAERRRFMNIS